MVGPSVVVVDTNIAKSVYLASGQRRHNVKIGEKLTTFASNHLVRAPNATNRVFVRPRLLTTPSSDSGMHE